MVKRLHLCQDNLYSGPTMETNAAVGFLIIVLHNYMPCPTLCTLRRDSGKMSRTPYLMGKVPVKLSIIPCLLDRIPIKMSSIPCLIGRNFRMDGIHCLFGRTLFSSRAPCLLGRNTLKLDHTYPFKLSRTPYLLGRNYYKTRNLPVCWIEIIIRRGELPICWVEILIR